MIVEGIAVATLASILAGTDKSMKLDEQAMRKYGKAFMKEEARQKLIEKQEFTDKRLANVANKKRAIIEVTIPRFVEVYERIQKLNISKKEVVFEISNINEQVSYMKSLSISRKKEFSDKELVCGLIKNGLGGTFVKDSERFLSAANSQMRATNVVCSQMESIECLYDAIVERANRIAKLLTQFNFLFMRSIDETEKLLNRMDDIIEANDYEIGVFMTCANIADAISKIINIPVVTPNGKIVEAASEMISTGEKKLNELEKIIRSGE